RPEILRRRIDDLDSVDRARLRLAAAWASGAKWLTLIDPFASVPGHLRTGLRNRFAELVAHDGRGVVFSSNSLTDDTIAEPCAPAPNSTGRSSSPSVGAPRGCRWMSTTRRSPRRRCSKRS